MSFDTLGLAPEYVRVVADEGYTTPTPVQREAIPFVLAGRDLLATAQTGTGKTAAFVLPMLQRLHETGLDRRAVRALVLAPTRELALQVEASVRTYGARRPIRSVAIYGGVGFEPQARALRAGAQIVVATPGRLLDHLGQHTIDLTRVEILVLDEADRMLDMGFIRDIRRVIALLPEDRQNLLFSATFSADIRALAAGLLDRPAYVDISPPGTAAELVDHLVIPVDRARKRELLSHLVRTGRIGQTLVFTRTKHAANRLAEQLGRDGIPAAAIHGNKSQGQRTRALDDFKRGRTPILVATDIFEMPLVAQDYVHRIGRTGRAGVDGQAVSLVCVDEAALLRDVEHHLRRPIPTEVIPGFEPDRSIRSEPIRLRSGGPAAGLPRRMAATPATGRPTIGARPPMGAHPFDRAYRPSGPGRASGPGRPSGRAPAPSRGTPRRAPQRSRRGARRPLRRRPPSPGERASHHRKDPPMKHSKHERARRALETEQTAQIAASWSARLDPDVAAAFTRQVVAASERGPLPRQPDMAPGTAPRPPRPGHEPRPPKDAQRPRRRAY
jgi:ATP-dependent RNA helicase RhlE